MKHRYFQLIERLTRIDAALQTETARADGAVSPRAAKDFRRSSAHSTTRTLALQWQRARVKALLARLLARIMAGAQPRSLSSVPALIRRQR